MEKLTSVLRVTGITTSPSFSNCAFWLRREQSRCHFSQENGVCRTYYLLQLGDASQVLQKANHALPDKWFPSGNPDLFNAKQDDWRAIRYRSSKLKISECNVREVRATPLAFPIQILKAQDLGVQQLWNSVLRHAVAATQVTAIGDR